MLNFLGYNFHMTTTHSFKFDTSEIDTLLKSFNKDINEEAFRITVNELALQSVNNSVRDLTKKYGVKYKRRGRNIPVWDILKAGGDISERAGTISMRRATKVDDTIYVNLSSLTLPLALFDTQAKNAAKYSNDKSDAKKQKIGIKVIKSKGVTRLKGNGVTNGKKWAILRLTMKNGHRGIFVRTDGKIREMKTLSPTYMYNDTGNSKRGVHVKQIEEFLNDSWNINNGEQLYKRYEHNLNYLLKKIGGKL